MKDEQFRVICQKLDDLIKLLALTYVKGLEIQKDKIIFLNSFGFQPAKIAEILGTTANTVRVAISREKTAK